MANRWRFMLPRTAHFVSGHLKAGWIFLLDQLVYRDNTRRYKRIPIVINNRNRYTTLRKLVEWLESNGYRNIYIIDNDSTYPPLLAYYERIPYKILRQGKNLGHLALWKSAFFGKLKWNYYVYTDSDILPVEKCPHDVLLHFLKTLKKHRSLDKVGFSLLIDDIPHHYMLRKTVIEWENQFWTREVEKGLFEAVIDTTFALYRPFTQPVNGAAHTMPAYRTDKPYSARHLPWYCDTDNLSEEELYYMNAASKAATWTNVLQQHINNKQA